MNQLLAIALLENEGYLVDAVADGAEAVEAVMRGCYDAVLMDCQMPVMDGYAAAWEIRRWEAGAARIPIIAVTASAMKGDAERALAAGMDDYVTKPVRPHELHRALDRLLRARGPLAGPSIPGTAPPAVGAFDQRALDTIIGIDGTGEALRAAVGLYVREAPAQAETLADAVARGDAKSVGEAAHAMRGGALSFGAVTLAQLTACIEREARAGILPTHENVASLREALAGAMAQLDHAVTPSSTPAPPPLAATGPH